MKAIVLAAGRGKRLKEVTEPVNKCMLKFNERHLIEYSLESASLSKVDEIIIVVGYRAEDIINTFGIEYEKTRIRYVFQEDQTGLVNAIEQCREALDGADFILHLADELLINPRPMEMIREFQNRDLFAMCGVARVEDRNLIKRTYSVIYNPETNQIYRLVEKPRNPFNDIMGTGNCIFRNGILELIQFTPIHYVRKEKELPDLIQCAIDDGMTVELFFVAAQYININTPEDIESAERLFT
jgi:NDP-sugar pyrophosphorylase family protein